MVHHDDDAHKLHKSKCNSIFTNLLQCHGNSGILSSAYIREFFETVRCDDVFNMTTYRNEYSSKINKGDGQRLDRILGFAKLSEEDEMVASQAIVHYQSWHEKQLVSALSWSSWVEHFTINKAERTLATLGIVGATYGGMRAAFASFRFIRESQRFRKFVELSKDGSKP